MSDANDSNEPKIINELHSIYAIHHSRHNVAMLRIAMEGRENPDMVTHLKALSEEMILFCSCATLITLGKYEEFVNYMFANSKQEDLVSLRAMYESTIKEAAANN